MIEIKHSRLMQVLSYDQDTGEFRWRVNLGTARVGNLAGAVRNDGYVLIRLDKTLYYAHRLAWFYVYGEWPSRLIDHRDTNTSNNRLGNLRLADRAQNVANAAGLRSDNTTGYRGVTRHKNKFLAQISIAGKYHSLGVHSTAEGAHAAYCDALSKAHGEFARAADHHNWSSYRSR